MSLSKRKSDNEKTSEELLSQWFTPEKLASKFVGWVQDTATLATEWVEPACGDGALYRHFPLDVGVYASDIDTKFLECDAAKALKSEGGSLHCLEGLLFMRSLYQAKRRQRVVAMNPPYENGLDGVFLETAMGCAGVVGAIIRLTALTGKARHKAVWSRVGPGESDWSLHARYLVRRPKFRLEGDSDGNKKGAMSDFVAVLLTDNRFYPTGDSVGWWGESWD